VVSNNPSYKARHTFSITFSPTSTSVNNHPWPQVQWPQPQAWLLLSPLISAELLAPAEVVANNEINRLTSSVPHAGQCTTAGFFSRTNSSKRFSQLVQ
jgi:hypothetical protein